MRAVFTLSLLALLGCRSPAEKAQALIIEAEAAGAAGEVDEADRLYLLSLEHVRLPAALSGRAELMLARGEAREAHRLMFPCKDKECDASRLKSAEALVAQLEQASIPEADVALYLERGHIERAAPGAPRGRAGGWRGAPPGSGPALRCSAPATRAAAAGAGAPGPRGDSRRPSRSPPPRSPRPRSRAGCAGGSPRVRSGELNSASARRAPGAPPRR